MNGVLLQAAGVIANFEFPSAPRCAGPVRRHHGTLPPLAGDDWPGRSRRREGTPNAQPSARKTHCPESAPGILISRRDTTLFIAAVQIGILERLTHSPDAAHLPEYIPEILAYLHWELRRLRKVEIATWGFFSIF